MNINYINLCDDIVRVQQEAAKFGYDWVGLSKDAITGSYFHRIENVELRHSTSVDYDQPVELVLLDDLPYLSVGPSGIGGPYQKEKFSPQPSPEVANAKPGKPGGGLLIRIVKRFFKRLNK